MGALTQFLEEFTYAGIFIALFLAGLGVPLPEEVPVLTAGVLAHEQVVRWWLALPVCVLGVLSGDTVLYWVGRHWGERVLAWRMVRRVLTREREEALKVSYRRKLDDLQRLITHYNLQAPPGAPHLAGLRMADELAELAE